MTIIYPKKLTKIDQFYVFSPYLAFPRILKPYRRNFFTKSHKKGSKFGPKPH